MTLRKETDFPVAVESWGWKIHHIGVPTHEYKVGERHLPDLKFSVSGFPTSPFGVEWMRFEKDCELPELIQKVPHIAFVVNDLDHELRKKHCNILVKPNAPMKGIRVAMIEYDGCPIELIEIED